MAISYVGARSIANTNTTPELGGHASQLTGDFRVGALWIPDGSSFTLASGWTLVVDDETIGNYRLIIAFRFAAANDEGNANCSLGSSGPWASVTYTIRDVDTLLPFIIAPSTATADGAATGQTLNGVSVTPNVAGGMAIWWLSARYSATPTGKTITVDADLTSTSNLASTAGGTGHVVRAGRLESAAASATGAMSNSTTATTNGWRTVAAVIRPLGVFNQIVKAGGGASARAATGARVVEHAKTGSAAAGTAGSGAKLRELTNRAGGAAAGRAATGSRTVEHAKTAAAAAGVAGSGTRIRELAGKSGAAVAGAASTGTRACDLPRTGAAATAAAASGTSSRDFGRVGSAASACAATGSRVVDHGRLGAGAAGAAATGSRVRDLARTGAAATDAAATGSRVVDFGRTGGAANAAAGSGVRVVEHARTGGGAAETAATGVRVVEFAKVGGAAAGMAATGIADVDHAGTVHVKTGAAAGCCAASGDRVRVLERSGAAGCSGAVDGARSRIYVRASAGVGQGAGTGPRGRDLPRTGGAAALPVATGSRSRVYGRTGAAVAALVGVGLVEIEHDVPFAVAVEGQAPRVPLSAGVPISSISTAAAAVVTSPAVAAGPRVEYAAESNPIQLGQTQPII